MLPVLKQVPMLAPTPVAVPVLSFAPVSTPLPAPVLCSVLAIACTRKTTSVMASPCAPTSVTVTIPFPSAAAPALPLAPALALNQTLASVYTAGVLLASVLSPLVSDNIPAALSALAAVVGKHFWFSTHRSSELLAERMSRFSIGDAKVFRGLLIEVFVLFYFWLETCSM